MDTITKLLERVVEAREQDLSAKKRADQAFETLRELTDEDFIQGFELDEWGHLKDFTYEPDCFYDRLAGDLEMLQYKADLLDRQKSH